MVGRVVLKSINLLVVIYKLLDGFNERFEVSPGKTVPDWLSQLIHQTQVAQHYCQIPKYYVEMSALNRVSLFELVMGEKEDVHSNLPQMTLQRGLRRYAMLP